MVSLLTWVAVGVLAYTVAAVLLDRRGLLPESVRVSGPITTLRTQRGKAFLDWLAGPRRFWRAWANFGVGVALVVMVGAFAFLLLSAVTAVRNPPEATAVNQPRNVLVVPGVNDFLPLSVAPEIVFGLVVGLVVHEGGHGLLCRVEGIDIESMGLAFLAFIPIGAFVEPEESSRERASRGGQTRMFAAGVTNNFAITLLAFGLLFGPVVASIAVAPGTAVGAVVPNSTAADAGIERGDRITAVDGQPVDGDLTAVLSNTTDSRVTVTVDGDREIEVDRRLVVTAAVGNSPTNLSQGATIRRVDGEPVRTERAFRDLVADRERVTVETSQGNRTFAVGAFVAVARDEPLNASGAPTGEMVITRVQGAAVGDVRTTDLQALIDALDRTDPGDEVTVAGYADGERRTFNVTLGEDDDGGGFVGIRGVQGVSGARLDDFGVQSYPAEAYLSALGGDGGDEGGGFGAFENSFFGRTVVVLYLPLSGELGTFAFNFPGFTGANLAFYETTGPLAALGGWVFLLANVLFWIGWINVQLAFFNCIPALPLDGGRILRTSAETVLSRLPVEGSRRAIRTITAAVGVTMVASFLLLVFGPQVLG